MQILKTIIQDAPMLRDFEDFKSYILKKSGLKEADFIQPLRILLTGTKQGPELSDIYPLIKSYLLEIAS
jgi:glutamyl-tRNA synthetase